jgi:GH15 family glucan-1,4-alpha-glucosidase
MVGQSLPPTILISLLPYGILTAITTLWLAEWYAVTAQRPDDLKPSLGLLEWVAKRGLPSGVLAEQVDTYTNAPLSVSPLTWSHAAYVATIQSYPKAAVRLNG